jgi:hypothetical protein
VEGSDGQQSAQAERFDSTSTLKVELVLALLQVFD